MAYHVGDLIRLAEEYPGDMSHFPGRGCRAIILEKDGEYKLYIEGCGEHAWFPSALFTFIEANRCDLLTEWIRKDRKVEATLREIAAEYRKRKVKLRNPPMFWNNMGEWLRITGWKSVVFMEAMMTSPEMIARLTFTSNGEFHVSSTDEVGYRDRVKERIRWLR